MLKYFDAKDKYVVDEPSLWTVNGSVDIQYAGGTEHKSGNFTIQVGNIESYNPTEIEQEPEPEVTPNPSSGGSSSGSGDGGESGGGGNTTENISSNIQEVHGSNKGNVPISLILNNTSNEDIYITGYLYCYIYKAEIGDNAPISYIIDPYSENSAKYYVPAKTRVTIPPEKLSIQVAGDNLPSYEVPSRYYGGVVQYSNGEPVNWRVYSWTKNSAGTLAHDPAVVDTVPGTVNFVSGGSVEYILRGTNETKEGTIIKYKNAINLETWEANPDHEPEPEITPNPGENTCYVVQTGGNGIKYVIHNQTGIEARLSGGVVLNLSRDPNDWEGSTQAYAHMHAPTIGSSYAYNDIIIPVGGTYTSPTVTTITGIYQPNTNFLDGTWYFMNTERSLYMHSIFIYSRIWNNNDKESQGSNHMYWAANPPQNAKLQNGITIHLFLTNVNPEATLQDASTGSGQSGHYVILDNHQTGLV